MRCAVSRRLLAVASSILLASAASACAPVAASGKLAVVTSTSVFADIIGNVGGEFVQVTSLVPRNGDVHTFAPRPADLRNVAAARILFMNGLGLDDWLAKTARNVAADGAPLVKLAEGLPGVELLPGETQRTQNPHLFMDPKLAELYVDRIATELGAVDPPHAAAYRDNAARYRSTLQALDGWIRSAMTAVPAANRKAVTFHDAFPYYAREYGIEIVGVAVKAPGQDPSAGDQAKLVEAIKSSGVKAIFSEAQFPTRLVDQIAAETGARVVSNLYDDALGDPPVTSYEAVIRWDTDQIVQALR